MASTLSPLAEARRRMASGESTPASLASEALARANSNAGRNVYLALDPDRTLREARTLSARATADSLPLYGIPVSLKDCFDVAGLPTTCGSRFYAERNGIAAKDSAVAARLRQVGAVLIGKTHLHQLAYGITGENPDYGDCAQPRDPRLLTGGSSSGAVASVQEGSAMAAIGTDTGGSVRVPAALCGLAGYRSSHGLADSLGLWEGGVHLAATFDTLGWIFRDLRDGPVLAQALFSLPSADRPATVRIGTVALDFLQDCGPDVLAAFEQSKLLLQSDGASLKDFSAGFWADSNEIFIPIQASESAAIHRGNFSHFEPAIAQRLAFGASLPAPEIAALRARHAEFRKRIDALFSRFDFLLLPATPLPTLAVGQNHAATRNTILRYTTPISLAGLPTVTLPGKGGGMQLAAARGDDARLLAYAASLRMD